MERWLLLVFSLVGFGLLMYALNTYFSILEDAAEEQGHAQLVAKIDNLSKEREAETQKQTEVILDNITHLIVKNGELISILLEQHDADNLTVSKMTPNPNISGQISSFLKSPPQIVKDESSK